MSFYIHITRCFALHLFRGWVIAVQDLILRSLQGADKKTNHKELFHWIEHPVKSLARLGLRKDDQR